MWSGSRQRIEAVGSSGMITIGHWRNTGRCNRIVELLFGKAQKVGHMKTIRTATALVFAALAAWLTLDVPYSVRAQPPAAGKGKGGGKGFAQDPRAQTRTYHFDDT